MFSSPYPPLKVRGTRLTRPGEVSGKTPVPSVPSIGETPEHVLCQAHRYSSDTCRSRLMVTVDPDKNQGHHVRTQQNDDV